MERWLISQGIDVWGALGLWLGNNLGLLLLFVFVVFIVALLSLPAIAFILWRKKR